MTIFSVGFFFHSPQQSASLFAILTAWNQKFDTKWLGFAWVCARLKWYVCTCSPAPLYSLCPNEDEKNRKITEIHHNECAKICGSAGRKTKSLYCMIMLVGFFLVQVHVCAAAVATVLRIRYNLYIDRSIHPLIERQFIREPSNRCNVYIVPNAVCTVCVWKRKRTMIMRHMIKMMMMMHQRV